MRKCLFWALQESYAHGADARGGGAGVRGAADGRAAGRGAQAGRPHIRRHYRSWKEPQKIMLTENRKTKIMQKNK